MDEKGFLLGLLKRVRRIVPTSFIKNGQIRGSLQDGSREFITLLAAISAEGRRLPPAIIYASQSGDMQDTWLEDFEPSDPVQRTYFATSETGWSSNNHGLSWLQQFDRDTTESAGYSPRLLIVDGHGSHITEEFINYAISHRIWLAVFPPHSTHILQPLDVSVFSPLALAYSTALDRYILQNHGFAGVTKRVFFSLFWPAWDKAVSIANIASGFEQTGIHPFNPSIVLQPLILNQESLRYRSQDPQQPQQPAETPLEVRRLIKDAHSLPPTQALISRLCNSLQHLSSQHDLMRHDNQQLRHALKQKKKKLKTRKAMGLLGDSDPKYGIFFTPRRVQRRKDAIQEAKDLAEAYKAAQASRKMQQKIRRLRDSQQKAEKRQNRIHLQVAREQEKIQRREDAKASRIARLARLQGKPQKKQYKKALQRKQQMRETQDEAIIDNLASPAVEAAQTRLGRAIRRPGRFST
jgi:hypothetical protein